MRRYSRSRTKALSHDEHERTQRRGDDPHYSAEPRRLAAMSKAARTAGHTRIACNSCRNRHCPKFQGAAAREWLAAREADLPPVGYFHVVVTQPAEVADTAFHNKAWRTTCCSGRRRRPCSPSRPSPSISAPRSASSPCSTPTPREIMRSPDRPPTPSLAVPSGSGRSCRS